jgi:hypothetical protein
MVPDAAISGGAHGTHGDGGYRLSKDRKGHLANDLRRASNQNWRHRQDALPTSKIADNLEPHEIEFYERFIGDGNTVVLIPKDTGRPAKSTNDFIWVNNGGIEVEVKTIERLDYDAAAGAVRRAVSKAIKHDVVKDNFIIDTKDRPLTEPFLFGLQKYNLRNQPNAISRLWVYHQHGVTEVMFD